MPLGRQEARAALGGVPSHPQSGPSDDAELCLGGELHLHLLEMVRWVPRAARAPNPVGQASQAPHEEPQGDDSFLAANLIHSGAR